MHWAFGPWALIFGCNMRDFDFDLPTAFGFVCLLEGPQETARSEVSVLVVFCWYKKRNTDNRWWSEKEPSHYGGGGQLKKPKQLKSKSVNFSRFKKNCKGGRGSPSKNIIFNATEREREGQGQAGVREKIGAPFQNFHNWSHLPP